MVGYGPEALPAETCIEVLDSASCSYAGDDVHWAPQTTQDANRMPEYVFEHTCVVSAVNCRKHPSDA